MELPPFSLAEVVSRWQFAPVVTGFVVVAAGLYLWGALRVRRRHPARPWPLYRTALFLGGLAVVVIATQSGIGSYDDVLFYDHMVQHLLLRSTLARPRELRTLAGCLGHVVRRRCPAGLTMVAHSLGRLLEALRTDGELRALSEQPSGSPTASRTVRRTPPSTTSSRAKAVMSAASTACAALASTWAPTRWRSFPAEHGALLGRHGLNLLLGKCWCWGSSTPTPGARGEPFVRS